MLMPLPGPGGGETAEGLVPAQAVTVVEGFDLDEEEDLRGGGPVGPGAAADVFLEQCPEAVRGGVAEA
ncbi:hypothetical protein ACFV2H_37420 [Streptomyces sp. NPDC059629]|uniref:hypothetical protein n=1 Tax=Streptomyces sp. NPDC059629 TaxID=3346889 RepID=UPI0036A85A8A